MSPLWRHAPLLSLRFPALFGARDAAAGGTSCLVATHNPAAVPYFDTVHTMSNGRLDGSG